MPVSALIQLLGGHFRALAISGLPGLVGVHVSKDDSPSETSEGSNSTATLSSLSTAISTDLFGLTAKTPLRSPTPSGSTAENTQESSEDDGQGAEVYRSISDAPLISGLYDLLEHHSKLIPHGESLDAGGEPITLTEPRKAVNHKWRDRQNRAANVVLAGSEKA
ncbi:hypothetical protein PspLS_11931 [Pyricularia sp. CBS 133598]|nr:hypothetical protein PspLS_11931 [Pyricularia sp. CBS 133598]